MSLGLDLQRFLAASYAYYILNETVMPDEEFDAMAKRLLDGWDTFEHQHKHHVSAADLNAGTLFMLKEQDYPGMVAGAAINWIKRVKSTTALLVPKVVPFVPPW